MQNSLLNKVITVSDKIIKDSQYGQQAKLKDEHNLTYNVYETKQDGTISAAWKSLKDIKVGTTVQIGYVEEEKSYEGKAYTARTIRSFNFDIGNGVLNAQSHQTTNTPNPQKSFSDEPSTASQSHSRDEFSRRLGIQGHINALLGNTNVFSPIDMMGALKPHEIINLAIQIEDECEKQLKPPTGYEKFKSKGKELPVIQVEDIEELPPIESYDDIADSVPF